MNKAKTSFFCSNCGHESAKWTGKCPTCAEWNTFSEEIVFKNDSNETELNYILNSSISVKKPININDIDAQKEQRQTSFDMELDRVLGGGLVMGSIVLIGGEPGIGKSTLFLQMGLGLKDKKVLYISGEESEQQIKMRAERLKIKSQNFYILTETQTQKITQQIKSITPDILIVDSIQTMTSIIIDSPPGTVSQIRQTASEFQYLAKELNLIVFLIGHITKDGNIAGPKILEHIVDTVLQFEGDRHYSYRILRTLKNRFGSVAELGIYEMKSDGLKAVSNPSELLISQKSEQLSGTTIAATIEGVRPLLVETQALVTQAVYGTPQRTVTGFDLRRIQILLAVLEKKGGFLFNNKDVFVNIAGGIKIDDPALDLAIVCALLSSFNDLAISSTLCFSGEIGLNGEVRAVNKIENRIIEAEKLGFDKMVIAHHNLIKIKHLKNKIELIAVKKVEEVYKQIFK